ncbi:MAG: MATE family efflux transporter, partial [Aquificae bacterium]|nr:MATE family efflux transporter [Aquificota bacterium]
MIKKILKIAVPSALSNLLDTLQLLVDMLMIGRLSPEAVAGVGLGGQLIILIYSIISVFYIGTNVLVSRAIGGGEKEKIRLIVPSLVITSVLFSLPFLIFTMFYPETFFRFMGGEESVVKIGSSYVSVIGLTLPLLFAGAVLHSSVVATGDTKTPLFITVFTNG